MSDHEQPPENPWRRLRNREGEDHFYKPPPSDRVVEGAWRVRKRDSEDTIGWQKGPIVYSNFVWQSLFIVGLRPVSGGMVADHDCAEPEYWRYQTDVPEPL